MNKTRIETESTTFCKNFTNIKRVGPCPSGNQGSVCFNNVPLIKENIQKYLGLFLDSKLSFFDHVNEKK